MTGPESDGGLSLVDVTVIEVSPVRAPLGTTTESPDAVETVPPLVPMTALDDGAGVADDLVQAKLNAFTRMAATMGRRHGEMG